MFESLINLAFLTFLSITQPNTLVKEVIEFNPASIIIEVDKTFDTSIFEKEITVNLDSRNGSRGLTIDKSVEHFDNLRALDIGNEKIFFADNIKIVNNSSEQQELEIRAIDFDINRTDCSDRLPKFIDNPENSATEWVSFNKKSNSKGEASIDVLFQVPSNIGNKTYWTAVLVNKNSEGIDSSVAVLYFLTPGSIKSEKCLLSQR
ncbi:MAG: hypothetical protein Q9M91_02385 [Candidatus Dojkabacteria bacterium]|nr:hypothetical protein [Candidatus Dojkabacteria bacterium]MDQ7020673.1 hypothetical protein [Candidatus Dojkabacteria bacterium]